MQWVSLRVFMKISDEVIKVLEYLCEKIGITIDWTNDNVLPYVEQLCGKFIKWEIETSTAWIVISIIAIVVALIFSNVVDLGGFEQAIFWCSVVIAVITIICQAFDIIKCYTFPEKALYDYVQFHLNSSGW